MNRVFLGVGSNEGDRLSHLAKAVEWIGNIPGVRVIQRAPIYETKPIGGPPQPLYLNTVVEIETDVPPWALLTALKALEEQLGRLPDPVRWAPRVIDLDILLYGDQIVSTPDLIIPHVRLHARRFALEPLARIAPSVMHPVLKRTIGQLVTLVRELPHGPAVRLLDDAACASEGPPA